MQREKERQYGALLKRFQGLRIDDPATAPPVSGAPNEAVVNAALTSQLWKVAMAVVLLLAPILVAIRLFG